MRIDAVAAGGRQDEVGERVLRGLGVSPGIAIGPAHLGEGGELPVRERHIPPTEAEAERQRFAEAVAVSLRQLRKLKTKTSGLPESAAEEIGYLLDAHLAMLSNSRLVRGVDQRIAKARINAERAVQLEIDEIAKSFAAMRDPYLAARDRGHPRRRHAADPQPDQEALRRLFRRCPRGAVILAEEVTPADTALMDPRADRRLRHRLRRRREPHRDRGARARPAGGARRRGPAQGRRGRSHGGDRRHRGNRHHRPVGADDPRIRGAARRSRARAASSRTLAPAAGGDPRRGRDRPRSQYRAAGRARAGCSPMVRWASVSSAPNSSS